MDSWTVLLDDTFATELSLLSEDVQDELLAHGKRLQVLGPHLARPKVDTLNQSRFTNMKELRFDAVNAVWRVAFAFDPERRAILLAAGDKAGTSEKRFYKKLINRADARFAVHLQSMTSSRGGRA
jgi:hypothetical protein